MDLFLNTNKHFITLVVVISPPSPDGVYTVEVQRGLNITCTGANSDDIVAWIRKSTYNVQDEAKSYLFPVIQLKV